MRVMTLGRYEPVSLETFVSSPPRRHGLGDFGVTDALGVGVIAFVVGGALGFALGAGVTASATRPRW